MITLPAVTLDPLGVTGYPDLSGALVGLCRRGGQSAALYSLPKVAAILVAMGVPREDLAPEVAMLFESQAPGAPALLVPLPDAEQLDWVE